MNPYNQRDELAKLIAEMQQRINPPQPKPQSILADALAKAKPANNGLPIFTQPQKVVPQAPVLPIFLRKPRVFVSFDYENDKHYKFLLSAWNKNSRFQFTFQDKSSQEVNTNDVGRVKAVLTQKIKDATYVLVIVGQYATQRHTDTIAIGCTNWINYEIQQAKLYKRKLVVVRLQPNYPLPDQCSDAKGLLVEGYSQPNIMRALAQLKEMK
jgi:hypothetical protein